MKRPLRRIACWLAALTLAACGDGSVAVVWSTSTGFIVWIGNSDAVIDGRNQHFAFTTDSRCLYNFQTGRANSAFCLLPGSNQVAYGPFHGAVNRVLASDGTCVAALTDGASGNFIDIDLDAFDREVVTPTTLRPQQCAP